MLWKRAWLYNSIGQSFLRDTINDERAVRSILQHSNDQYISYCQSQV